MYMDICIYLLSLPSDYSTYCLKDYARTESAKGGSSLPRVRGARGAAHLPHAAECGTEWIVRTWKDLYYTYVHSYYTQKAVYYT